MTTLNLENLSAGYGRSRRDPLVVVRDVSVELRAGEMVCLLGPNGAGKSTLMRTVAGMQPPVAGRVFLNGEDIHRLSPRELAKRLSVVLTDRVSIGVLSAYALVSLGRYPYTDWTGRLTDRDHKAVQGALQAVGADDLASRNVIELSDGERQRIMVARALAQETPLMVLDEITAFLDLPRRVEIMRILRDLAHVTGKAILLSTHDLELALRSADRLWLLPRNGAFQHGSPEELVLSGAFESAFHSEGVDFDRSTGAFRLHRGQGRSIVLEGDGIHATWTARALEREGFQVVSASATDLPHSDMTRIKVVTDREACLWQIFNDDGESEYETLDGAIQSIRSAARN
jgi:iron complex transport system ATP-binding protein